MVVVSACMVIHILLYIAIYRRYLLRMYVVYYLVCTPNHIVVACLLHSPLMMMCVSSYMHAVLSPLPSASWSCRGDSTPFPASGIRRTESRRPMISSNSGNYYYRRVRSSRCWVAALESVNDQGRMGVAGGGAY